MASPGSQGVLLVEVPEAEPAVARHRERLDANAPLGIPAHITVLFPFTPPEVIGPPVLGDLGRRTTNSALSFVRKTLRGAS